MGQRLQRQGNAWRGELKHWITFTKRDKVVIERVTLGCELLIKLCDLLHVEMFQSNSESLEIRELSRTMAPRNGVDCSLLLSVTDPALPLQPGSNQRYWFPKERQLKQPQTLEPLGETSEPLIKSADLETLLATRSFADLKEQCTQLKCRPLKRNRLQMAESILFAQAAQAASKSRQPPVLLGKVYLSIHGLSCGDSSADARDSL